MKRLFVWLRNEFRKEFGPPKPYKTQLKVAKIHLAEAVKWIRCHQRRTGWNEDLIAALDALEDVRKALHNEY